MSSTAPVTYTQDGDNVGWIVFDDPSSRANVFNPATLAALGAAIDAAASAGPKAVVVTSAKEKIFIAGADLKWLGGLADTAAAEKASRDGQALFARLEKLGVPVVCSIHGACAGGGCEIALACHLRIASEALETTIGLPEVGIGVIPGWGGCARLPRLVGAAAALDHILKAQLLAVPAALKAGIVDEVVPAAELKNRAKVAALKLAAEGLPKRAEPAQPDAAFFADQRKRAGSRMRGQPAPVAAIDAVEKGLGRPLAEALGIEAGLFGQVASGEVAKNLVRVFFLKDAAKKRTVDAWFPGGAGGEPQPFRLVGIVGAGVMGSGIAQWCAGRGIGVMMTDTDVGALKRGVEVVRELFKEDVRRGRLSDAAAHKAMGSIGMTTDIEDFADCDVVIEAIVENVAIKQTLFEKLSKVVRPDCVLASNTSALPIEEIADRATLPGRAIGIHFFNPVGRMPLVEIVLSPHTSRDTAARTLNFVKRLGKMPVICRSAPGFFVTRVLFFYLNAACRLWEKGVRTEAIDAAMRDWGWPMGPMRLIDEVGVDVTDFIYGEMKHYYGGRFEGATVCNRMLAAGLKGRKNGASSGFYTYIDGREALNGAMSQFAPAGAENAMSPAEIQEHLNGVMIDETRRVLEEGVLKSEDDADFALLTGAGFPAFRGGLMRYAKSTGRYNR